MRTYDLIIDAANARGADLEFAGPQSQSSVDALEFFFGVALPPSYRQFLLECGAGGTIPGFSGVWEDVNEIEEVQVVADTLACRRDFDLPDDHIVVHYDDETLAIWVLAVATRDSKGESPVLGYNAVSKCLEDKIADDFDALVRECYAWNEDAGSDV